ncbi:MAG TPA: hypothetical protein VHB18_01865 [Mycobacteriales bacterium]|nr:hypothetical protein [Mycobacteriales bacterium]
MTRRLRAFDNALALLPFAALALVRLGHFVEGDTFWGVRAGQQIVAEHSVHLHDVLSWTRAGQPWHPNEWGYDAALWFAYRLDGMIGLQLLVAATIVLLGVVVLVAVRAFRGGARDVFWLGLFASPLLLGWVSARAQTFSYSMQLLELLLLARLFLAEGRAVWRWAAVLLGFQVVWVNVHEAALSGAVVAVGSAVVRGVTLLRRNELAGGSTARLVLGPVLVLVGSLCGPFGWRVFADSERTRSESAGAIIEWKSIVTTTAGVRAEVVAGLVLLIAVAALWRRERGTSQECLADVWFGAALVLAPAAVVAVRFVALLMLVELVAVVALVRSGRLRTFVASRQLLLNGGASVVAVALVIIGVRQLTLSGEPTTSDFPSVRLVKAIPPGCLLLNEYNDGGWISLLRGPGLGVSQDGRNVLYGRKLIFREGAVLAGRHGVAGVNRLGATCVLAAPSDGLVRELATDPGWTLADRDARRVLFLSRSSL